MSVFSALLSPDASARPIPSQPTKTIDFWKRANEICNFAQKMNLPIAADLYYLRHRRLAIAIALIFHPLEATIYRRRNVRSTVQIAATLYREMHLRAETLCEEYNPSLLRELKSIT